MSRMWRVIARLGGAREVAMKLADHQMLVERLPAAGRPLGEIERLIDMSPLTGSQKSMLWLAAWKQLTSAQSAAFLDGRDP